jgi:hypothetical protein
MEIVPDIGAGVAREVKLIKLMTGKQGPAMPGLVH